MFSMQSHRRVTLCNITYEFIRSGFLFLNFVYKSFSMLIAKAGIVLI